jgi:branched-subunit amino acid transport protein
MTWGLVLGLAAGAYLFKVLGLVIIGGRAIPPALDRCLALVPAALIAAIVVKDTFSIGQHMQVDARLAGVAAAVIAAWRKAPVVVVIVVAAGVTAAIRAING